MLLTTSPTSGFWSLAEEFGVPCVLIGTDGGELEANLRNAMEGQDIYLLFLAGFLRLLPEGVISQLEGRVVNTHPALLPKHGGKGMYGIRVHEAVIDAGDKETGATMHWVTPQYDEGAIIAQIRVPVEGGMGAQALQERVKEAERRQCVEILDAICSDRL